MFEPPRASESLIINTLHGRHGRGQVVRATDLPSAALLSTSLGAEPVGTAHVYAPGFQTIIIRVLFRTTVVLLRFLD